MSDRVMLTVFCYDVVRTRTRDRVATRLENSAVRVQDSVFETRLTRAASERLFRRITELLDPGDLLRMYAVGAAGLDRCRTHGGAPIAGDGDFWIV
jgi:CRISPR-associated protein Cas2